MRKRFFLIAVLTLSLLFLVLTLLGIFEDAVVVKNVNSSSYHVSKKLAPALALKIAKQFAPYVYFHPKEKYFPSYPEKYISKARLRRYKIFSSDESYNKQTKIWDANNKKTPEYYGIPLEVINSFSLSLYGKPLRPKWIRSALNSSVSLELDEEEDFTGNPDPNGNVPVYYDLQLWEEKEEGKDALRIRYWWFMAYNEAPALGTFFNHQGDWEHITVYIKKKNKAYVLHSVYMSAHNWGYTYTPEELEMDISSGEKKPRVVVYCAKGSHASYSKADSYPIFTSLVQDQTGRGYKWKTWLKLADLSTQPWKDYAGAWGKVGYVVQGTGPLGPWLRKLKTISLN